MKAVPSNESITAYERAICYYTLPKITSPVTYGLVAAYAVCLLEATGALLYGMTVDDPSWTTAGAIAVTGIVILGMIAFTVRAVLNDWRKRSALAAARNVPDANTTTDIPDPFAGHILIRRPAYPSTEVYACVTNAGTIEYYVEVRSEAKHWCVRTPQDQMIFEVLVEHNMLRLGIFRINPMHAGVYADRKKIAAIVSRNTLRAPVVDVFDLAPKETKYIVKDGCIFAAGRLVGRIYDIRDYLYLDIEQEHATSGILAHFMTLG